MTYEQYFSDPTPASEITDQQLTAMGFHPLDQAHFDYTHMFEDYETEVLWAATHIETRNLDFKFRDFPTLGQLRHLLAGLGVALKDMPK